MEFQPFSLDAKPMKQQFMSWHEMVKDPYDKRDVDAYTRTRVILMNGIENHSVLASHAVSRMIGNEEIKRVLAWLRRADSQQQQTVNWLNPANQTVAETTIGYEQVAVDLTSDLAQSEEDQYFKQVLDFALIEDFDHLFRYGCLLELLENTDPNTVTQGKTEILPGRPTVVEHRHPFDSMRKHYDKDTASVKTKMNYHTITAAEQQTMLYYKSHGFMYDDILARRLYAEIAEIEEQHVTQYELLGDPRESPLEKLAMIQLMEAYNYYSCAMTETDPRICDIWSEFCEWELGHFHVLLQLIQRFEQRDLRETMKLESITPLIEFHENKEYVRHIVDTQVDLQPHNMEFVPYTQLPDDWPSFGYRAMVNRDGVPSEDVANRAKEQGKLPKAA